MSSNPLLSVDFSVLITILGKTKKLTLFALPVSLNLSYTRKCRDSPSCSQLAIAVSVHWGFKTFFEEFFLYLTDGTPERYIVVNSLHWQVITPATSIGKSGRVLSYKTFSVQKSQIPDFCGFLKKSKLAKFHAGGSRKFIEICWEL